MYDDVVFIERRCTNKIYYYLCELVRACSGRRPAPQPALLVRFRAECEGQPITGQPGRGLPCNVRLLSWWSPSMVSTGADSVFSCTVDGSRGLWSRTLQGVSSWSCPNPTITTGFYHGCRYGKTTNCGIKGFPTSRWEPSHVFEPPLTHSVSLHAGSTHHDAFRAELLADVRRAEREPDLLRGGRGEWESDSGAAEGDLSPEPPRQSEGGRRGPLDQEGRRQKQDIPRKQEILQTQKVPDRSRGPQRFNLMICPIIRAVAPQGPAMFIQFSRPQDPKQVNWHVQNTKPFWIASHILQRKLHNDSIV